MLISTVLVLLMIIPGLALFYGGLVRSKNMISLLSQVLIVTAIGMVAWVGWGYSMSFTDGGGHQQASSAASRRSASRALIHRRLVETFSVGVAIPEIVFVAFQMTFACITTALVLGGVAERAKFWGVVLFAVLWPIVVYYPMAHMVWWWGWPDHGVGSRKRGCASCWLGSHLGFGALDFAGGTVVHINSGIAALVGALILGKRKVLQGPSRCVRTT
jgi:Amt family ammonium transporter